MKDEFSGISNAAKELSKSENWKFNDLQYIIANNYGVGEVN